MLRGINVLNEFIEEIENMNTSDLTDIIKACEIKVTNDTEYKIINKLFVIDDILDSIYIDVVDNKLKTSNSNFDYLLSSIKMLSGLIMGNLEDNNNV